MLVVYLPSFMVDKKIFFGYDFDAPLIFFFKFKRGFGKNSEFLRHWAKRIDSGKVDGNDT